MPAPNSLWPAKLRRTASVHLNLLRANRTLVAKLTLLVAATVVVLLAVLLVTGFFFWTRILREQIDARLTAVADSRGDFVRQWIAQQEDRAQIYATRGILRSWLERTNDRRPSEQQRLLSQQNLDRHVESGAAIAVRIADIYGHVILSTDSAEVGSNWATHPTFISGLVAPSVGHPRQAGKRYEVMVATPVRRLDPADETLAVVLYTLDATPLADTLRATTGLGQTGEVVLAVRDGDRARFLVNRQEVIVPLAAVPAMAAALAGRKFIGVTRDYRGESVLAVGRPVGYGGWGLVAKMELREAQGPIVRAARYALILGGIVGIAGIVAAFLVARSFVQPIRALAAATARVAAGDYDHAVPVQRVDELGDLAACFNEMIAAVRAHKAEREARESAVRTLNEQLEARVAERTAELRETVVELERFSYSISHDMRAPLRTMEGYAAVVLEDCGDKLSQDARHYLQRIVAAASRQDRLITDILSYSKVARSRITLARIDLDEVVHDLLQEYPNLRENAAAIIVQSPLGFVLGHDLLLTQCLSNLLNNALKFMPPGREPRVVVRSEHEDGWVRLWVEDNGIGIAAEHHARVFEMLERVYSDREYEGTGIGLAIVRKATDRMGGKVGVVSSPGQGSRFWLELHAAESEPTGMRRVTDT